MTDFSDLHCLRCGKYWGEDVLDDPTYPGSACDTGECMCLACETRDDGLCIFHEALREKRQKAGEPR